MSKNSGGYLHQGLTTKNPSSSDLGVKTPKNMPEMGAKKDREGTASTPATLGPRTA